jgi:hypothetical protein
MLLAVFLNTRVLPFIYKDLNCYKTVVTSGPTMCSSTTMAEAIEQYYHRGAFSVMASGFLQVEEL